MNQHLSEKINDMTQRAITLYIEIGLLSDQRYSWSAALGPAGQPWESSSQEDLNNIEYQCSTTDKNHANYTAVTWF